MLHSRGVQHPGRMDTWVRAIAAVIFGTTVVVYWCAVAVTLDYIAVRRALSVGVLGSYVHESMATNHARGSASYIQQACPT